MKKKTKKDERRLRVKHIGIIYALCSPRKSANLRDDLGAPRYRQLGVSERFVNEKPYRICKRCIAVVDLPYSERRARTSRLLKRSKR